MGIFKAYQEVFTLRYARRCLLYDYQALNVDKMIQNEVAEKIMSLFKA